MPLFSVVIPAYNSGDFVARAIESVAAQRCADCEIVVVDDGSTDNTVEVVRSFGSRVSLVQQPNQGPGAARNAGIARAAGEYVVFLDSDDLWFPWTLATFSQAVEAHRRPAFLAGTGVDFVDETELRSLVAGDAVFEHFNCYLSAAPRDFWIGTPAAAIRADVLRRIGGFCAERINAEDSDLWLRLGVEEGFVHIQCPPLFGYRRRPHSAIANLDATYRGMRHLIRQEAGGRYPGGTPRRRERLRILTRHIRPASIACARAGKLRQGSYLYLRTIGWNIACHRWKYLLGFPALALLGCRSRG